MKLKITSRARGVLSRRLGSSRAILHRGSTRVVRVVEVEKKFQQTCTSWKKKTTGEHRGSTRESMPTRHNAAPLSPSRAPRREHERLTRRNAFIYSIPSRTSLTRNPRAPTWTSCCIARYCRISSKSSCVTILPLSSSPLDSLGRDTVSHLCIFGSSSDRVRSTDLG